MRFPHVEIDELDLNDFVPLADERVQYAIDIRRVGFGEVGTVEDAFLLAVRGRIYQAFTSCNEKIVRDTKMRRIGTYAK